MKKEKIFITGKNIELFVIRAERVCCIFNFFYVYYQHTAFPEGPKMLYKHWKKILLALTGFFWASCDSDPSSASDESPSSSSIENQSSSSTTGGQATSSSTEEATSSSSENAAVSSGDTPNATSSSSENMIDPKYGVPMSSSMVAAKYGVIAPSSSSEIIAAKYGVPMPTCENIGEGTYVCDDGVTCTDQISETMQAPECTGDQVCAKYGVVIVKDTVYKCDDGKTYNAAEFRNRYNILDGAVDLYGCPSDICGTEDTTFTEVMPLYGIPSNMNNSRN